MSEHSKKAMKAFKRDLNKEFEARRIRITKVIMKRHFADGFQDIGQLILDVEKLVESEQSGEEA